MGYSPVHGELTSRISTPMEDDEHQPRPSRPLWTSLRSWKWELATWLLGTTALGAIITLLILYRDKPVKNWPVGFSLATTIAALSQVAQSALLVSVSACIGQLKWSYLRNERSTLDISRFEEASRGPRGSLMLLLSTRPHLVSVGAIATILLLGFSPFAQQSVTIEVRSTNGISSPTSAIIGRSVQYVNDATNASFVEYDLDSQSRISIMYHPHMSKGILAGILDDVSSPSDVIGSCQAEVCTWEPYQTLAVCSFVEDISADGAMDEPGPYSPDGSRMYYVGPESWSRDQTGVNISETFWMNTQIDTQDPDARAENYAPLRNISTTYVAYYPPCDHNGNPRADWVGQRDDAANWKGFQGSLILCLQTLNSTYNLTMQTKVIDTQIDLDWQIKPGVSNDSQYRYCVTGQDNEEYCVGDTDITEWEYLMAKSLTGAAAIYPNEANYSFTGQLAPNIVTDVLGDSPAYCNGSTVKGGFERRMNNIAISMSNT